MNDAYGNHFTSEHENHPHDLVSVGHTHLNEGIDYEQTCDEDSQFIIETLPDGRKNPNYLHDEFSAYVFIVAGWGGFGLSGLQTDQREDREELINFLYDNNAQVIRGDWTWLPVDGKERFQNANGPRCHQSGPNGQLVDSLKEGPVHNPSAWNLIVEQWKDLMSQPRSQELIQEKKVIVFGHSFGGNAVSRIGELTETRIDLLGIADPVGHRALQYNTIFEADCLLEDPRCWLPTLKTIDCTIPGIPGLFDEVTITCAAHFENNHPQREISSNVKKLVMAWQETELPPTDFITHTNDGAVDSNAFFTFQTYLKIVESFEKINQASIELKNDFGAGPVDDPQLISSQFSPKIHDALQPFREAIQIDPAKLGYLTSPQTEVVFQKKILDVGHSGIWDSDGTGLTELTGTYVGEMKNMNSKPSISVTNTEIVLEDGTEFLKVSLEGVDQDQDNLQFRVIDPQPKIFDLTSSGSGNQIMGTLMIPTSEPSRTIILVEDDGWPCTNCKGPNAPTINGEKVIDGAWDAIIILFADGVFDIVPCTAVLAVHNTMDIRATLMHQFLALKVQLMTKKLASVQHQRSMNVQVGYH